DDLNLERSYSPVGAYARSKLANLLFTYELQRRLTAAGQNTLSVASHPGWVRTNLTRHSNAMIRLLDWMFAQKAIIGAFPTLYAATAPEVQGGEYFGPGGFRSRSYPKKDKSNDRSHDEASAQRLW